MNNHLTNEAHRKLASVLFAPGERGDEGLRHGTEILDEQGHFHAIWREAAQAAAKDSIAGWLPGANSKLEISRRLVESNPPFRDAVLRQANADQVAFDRTRHSNGINR
jgi:hypothetical protein